MASANLAQITPGFGSGPASEPDFVSEDLGLRLRRLLNIRREPRTDQRPSMVPKSRQGC